MRCYRWNAKPNPVAKRRRFMRNGTVRRSGASEKDPIRTSISLFHVERFSEAALSVYLASPHQEESLQRAGNRNWILPQPSIYLLHCVHVPPTAPENAPRSANTFGTCPPQKFVGLS